mmetsp:Transcript_12346/g.24591  ORF Transcript_12346/g.24591 Transcript_12346/m.24591 type:complete len:98 (-) Transcript_12346:66-359(-)
MVSACILRDERPFDRMGRMESSAGQATRLALRGGDAQKDSAGCEDRNSVNDVMKHRNKTHFLSDGVRVNLMVLLFSVGFCSVLLVFASKASVVFVCC